MPTRSLLNDSPQDESFESAEMPLEPPTYDDIEIGHPEEEMLLEDSPSEQVHWYSQNIKENSLVQVLQNIKDYLYDFVVIPFRLKVVRPLMEYYYFFCISYEYYLAKIGNPLIMKRFVYVFLMSIFAYGIFRATMDETARAVKGTFSDHDELLHYAKRCVDLAKFEQDLEYLSSMHHNSGTKGDLLFVNYIEESLNKNGIKLSLKSEYDTYLNFPTDKSTLSYYVLDENNEGQERQEISLSNENFNPLSINGDLKGKSLLYNNYGTHTDYDALDEKSINYEDAVIVLKYSELVSEQILLAQEKKVAGIIFISRQDADDGPGKETTNQDSSSTEIGEKLLQESKYDDLVQMIGVGITQYGIGDPLSPGWSSNLPQKITLEHSNLVPKIPTLPVSINQIRPLLRTLLVDKQAVHVDMHVELDADERHPSWDLVAKIEGKEQNDKAIIIAAARDSVSFGASYPNFGTATLLALAQLFQQIKYKYNWKPLRNIYFMSYDSSMYNYEGSTEILEDKIMSIRHEVYAFMDITQLGIDSNNLFVQGHPIFHDFFNKLSDKFDFQIKTKNVQQYGGWTPYMAKGFPVVVLSSKSNLENSLPKFSKGDDWENMKKTLYKEYKDGNGWDRTSRLILYTLEVALGLADDPIIPFNFGTFTNSVYASYQDLEEEVKNLDEEGKQIDLSPIKRALDTWTFVVKEWEHILFIWNQIVNEDGNHEEPSLIAIHRWAWNRKLAATPLKQVDSKGISNERRSYKNIIFGPTLWSSSSYEWWSFPGVRDALRSKNWDSAQESVNAVGDILQKTAIMFKEEDAAE